MTQKAAAVESPSTPVRLAEAAFRDRPIRLKDAAE